MRRLFSLFNRRRGFKNMNFSGEQLRDQGIKVAEDHANSETPQWTDLAYQALKDYPGGVEHFTCEQVRAWAEENGVPAPPDARSWGGTFQRASRAKLITKIGYIQGEGAQCHKGVKTLWAFNL